MSDTHSMNDEAARSPTGEILDQSTPPPTTETKTPPTTETVADAPVPAADAPKPAEGEVTKPVETKSASGAPEKYADFTVPENYTLDPTAVEAALPIFKELNLSQDQAQKLVDMQIQRELVLAKNPENAVAAMRTDWQGKVKADPELAKATSGSLSGLDAVKADIGRALNVLPADLRGELREAFNLTGAGDHPAVIKALYKLSSYVTEGSHVGGKGPSELGQKKPGEGPPSAAKALYPNLPG